MHFFTPESYIENFSKLPRKRQDEESIVVTTSISSKEEVMKLKPFLASIMDQTIKVDQIVLNVPGSEEVENPHPRILSIFSTGKDYNDPIMNSVIPTLFREGEEDTVIISLRPDVVYGKDFIETMLRANVSKNSTPDVIKSASGSEILIRPKYFTKSILSHEGKSLMDCLIPEQKIREIKYNENYRKF